MPHRNKRNSSVLSISTFFVPDAMSIPNSAIGQSTWWLVRSSPQELLALAHSSKFAADSTIFASFRLCALRSDVVDLFLI